MDYNIYTVGDIEFVWSALNGIALIFSFFSLLYPLSTIWGSVLLTIAILIGLELFVEAIGLVGSNRQPLLHWINRIVQKLTSKNSD